jgi:hypothetical protein
MADILPFKASFRPARSLGRKPQGTAKVIIFPGVRIDREKFSLADRLKPAPLICANAKQTQPKQRD